MMGKEERIACLGKCSKCGWAFYSESKTATYEAVRHHMETGHGEEDYDVAEFDSEFPVYIGYLKNGDPKVKLGDWLATAGSTVSAAWNKPHIYKEGSDQEHYAAKYCDTTSGSSGTVSTTWSIPYPSKTEFDPVSNPEHYASGPLECIDWIEAELSDEEFKGYLTGNVLKYLWRYEDKGNPVQDLSKAQWYLERLKSHVRYILEGGTENE